MSSVTRFFLATAFAALAASSAPAMVPAAEAPALRAALAAQARGDFASAEAGQLNAAGSAAALLAWDRLRRPNYAASFADAARFLRDNPDWPGEEDMRRRAEGLIDDATPNSARLAYFRALPPLSGVGRFRHAEALQAAGLARAAETEAKQAWRQSGIGGALEMQFLARFGGILSRDDHVYRADRLLFANDVAAAMRMLPFLTGDDRVLVEARLALKRAATARGKDKAPAAVDASAALGKVPAALENHPGLLVDRSQFLRASGGTMTARQLFARTRIAPGSAVDRTAWMREALALARGAVADKQYALAFEIAHAHGGLAADRPLTSYDDDERDLYTSLEWLAGWTALHQAGRPREAIRHFENFAAAAKTSITRARGHYWAGRAADTAGIAVDATRNFDTAARFPLTFYGQLSTERLGRALAIPATTDPVVAPADRAAFNARGTVAAARLFGDLGERGRQNLFLKTLADTARTPAEEMLVSELAQSLGRSDHAIAASRGAFADGPPAIMRFAYPQLQLGPEFGHNWTMIHAITRQESRFDRNAVSHAGARGLMQLMPATARETAGKIGTAYRPDAITGDPAYNVLLGSTYYSNLVDQWGGNHVLAVASYNAGAGNARKWVAANGDPRLPGADVAKWIEEIPIFETRNYVQRVLENAVVYDRLKPRGASDAEPRSLTLLLGRRTPG